MKQSDYLKENLDIIERLKGLPILNALKEQNIKELLALSRINEYERGEMIIEEGQFDCWIYFLISGKIKMVKGGVEICTTDKSGEIFGEMAIIDATCRSASVYAVDKTTCLATDASCIDRLSGREKITFLYILYRIFAELLATRLRETTEKLIEAKKEISKLKGL